MEINFFTLWFLVSPFIILHLYLKNKEFNKANELLLEYLANNPKTGTILSIKKKQTKLYNKSMMFGTKIINL